MRSKFNYVVLCSKSVHWQCFRFFSSRPSPSVPLLRPGHVVRSFSIDKSAERKKDSRKTLGVASSVYLGIILCQRSFRFSRKAIASHEHTITDLRCKQTNHPHRIWIISNRIFCHVCLLVFLERTLLTYRFAPHAKRSMDIWRKSLSILQ